MVGGAKEGGGFVEIAGVEGAGTAIDGEAGAQEDVRGVVAGREQTQGEARPGGEFARVTAMPQKPGEVFGQRGERGGVGGAQVLERRAEVAHLGVEAVVGTGLAFAVQGAAGVGGEGTVAARVLSADVFAATGRFQPIPREVVDQRQEGKAVAADGAAYERALF